MPGPVVNLPPYPVWVRKEFLTDHTQGEGEFVEGRWCTAKSIRGRALYFETFLPSMGALYDKLPLSAFVARPERPASGYLSLNSLQIWDCFSHELTVVEKALLAGLEVSVRLPNGGKMQGQYLFTLDWTHTDSNLFDTSWVHHPDQHKSGNVIALNNGQFGCYPNNKILWREQSLVPSTLEPPDLRLSTRRYAVENGDWVAGDGNEWNYTLKKPRSSDG